MEELEMYYVLTKAYLVKHVNVLDYALKYQAEANRDVLYAGCTTDEEKKVKLDAFLEEFIPVQRLSSTVVVKTMLEVQQNVAERAIKYLNDLKKYLEVASSSSEVRMDEQHKRSLEKFLRIMDILNGGSDAC